MALRYIRATAIERALTALGAGPVTTPDILFSFGSASGLVRGIYLGTSEGTPAALAGLWIRMSDPIAGRRITTDTLNGAAGAYTRALTLMGRRRRWFPMERDVEAGQQWAISLKNTLLRVTMVPEVTFAFDDGSPEQAHTAPLRWLVRRGALL